MLIQTPIPDEFLKVGLTCAALFNKEWHRGKIIDIFGDTVKVKKKQNIRYILICFDFHNFLFF